LLGLGIPRGFFNPFVIEYFFDARFAHAAIAKYFDGSRNGARLRPSAGRKE
jgi:hypothetical protein